MHFIYLCVWFQAFIASLVESSLDLLRYLRISQTLNVYVCGIPPSIVSAILSRYYVVCKAHLKLKFSCFLWIIHGSSYYGGVICFVHITILVNMNNWGMPPRIYIWDYLISPWHAMSCLRMAFLCGFAHGYL